MNITAFLILLITGLSLLLFGRSLFWVYVALVGFLLGFEATQQSMGGEVQWVSVLVGLVVGLMAALGSVIFQKLAVAVAGFLGGAYLALSAIGLGMTGNAEPLTLLAVLLSGALGAVFFSLLFDPFLIVLSAIIGAGLLIQPFALDQSTAALAWLTLTAVGVVFQLLVLSKAEPPRAH